MMAKVVRASDTFIRLQGLVETFAAACSAGLLLGDGGGVELLLRFQPGLVALRRLFSRAATHEARHCEVTAGSASGVGVWVWVWTVVIHWSQASPGGVRLKAISVGERCADAPRCSDVPPVSQKIPDVGCGGRREGRPEFQGKA